MTAPTPTTAQRLGRLAPAGTPSPERWAQDLIERMRADDIGLYVLDEHSPDQLRAAALELRQAHRCPEPWTSMALAARVLDAAIGATDRQDVAP